MLKRISIPDGVEIIPDSMFQFCESLEYVELPNSLKIIGDEAFSAPIKTISIPTGVTTIGEAAFSGTKCREIVVPETVTSIGQKAFMGCEDLESVTINGNINKLDYDMFAYCTSLKNVNLNEGLKTIESDAFEEYAALEKIILPNSLEELNGPVFHKCYSLKEVILPSSIRIIGSAFGLCNALEEIIIPESVEIIKIGAFGCCNNLKELTILGAETVLEENMLYTRVEAGKGYTNYYYEGDTVIKAPKGSFAEIYASKYGIAFQPLCTTHDWDSGKVTKEATCIEDGIKIFTCKNCGVERTESIIASGHDLSYHEGKAATENEDGNSAYWTCFVCKKYFSDSQGKNEIDKSDWFIPAINHVHKITKVDKKDATCTESGSQKYWICDGCGKCFSESEGKNEIDKISLLIPARGHDPEIIPAVDPTCTNSGFTAGIKCSVCGKIQKVQEVIPAKGHVSVKDSAIPATEKSTGLTAGSHCSVCGTVLEKQKIIPKKENSNKSTSSQSKNSQNTSNQIKKAQPMTVKVSKKTVKYSKLKKKAQTVKPITVKSAQGTVTYKITGGNKKSKKALKINAKNGKITVKKKTKKGTYKVKVTVTAAGNNQYNAGSKTVNISVKVK